MIFKGTYKQQTRIKFSPKIKVVRKSDYLQWLVISDIIQGLTELMSDS